MALPMECCGWIGGFDIDGLDGLQDCLDIGDELQDAGAGESAVTGDGHAGDQIAPGVDQPHLKGFQVFGVNCIRRHSPVRPPAWC